MFAIKKIKPSGAICPWMCDNGMSSHPERWDFHDAKTWVDENPGWGVYHVRGFYIRQIYPKNNP